MKSMIAALLFTMSAANVAFADPVIVFRPATVGVLPPEAFGAVPPPPTTPSEPSTPPVTPDPPAPSVVFTSSGYNASLPLTSRVIGMGDQETVLRGTYNFCAIVDDAGKTLSSKMTVSFWLGSTPTVIHRPLRPGIFRLVLKCGANAGSAIPVEKFEFTAS